MQGPNLSRYVNKIATGLFLATVGVYSACAPDYTLNPDNVVLIERRTERQGQPLAARQFIDHAIASFKEPNPGETPLEGIIQLAGGIAFLIGSTRVVSGARQLRKINKNYVKFSGE